MRKNFSQFYSYSADQFSNIWGSCLFVLDANALLDLYRYTQSTSVELIEILKKVKDRLWLPHQVALEYFNNRNDVILTQDTMYRNAVALLLDLKKAAQEKKNQSLTFRIHPFIDKNQFLEDINNALDGVGKNLHERKLEYPDYFSSDTILETITDLYDDKVGNQYSDEKLDSIYKEGKIRYANKIPPGYLDAEGQNKKEDNKMFGDLIIWNQIIDHGKETNKSIIFITNDYKDDWWSTSHGKTIGPRPELVKEIFSKAGVLFYIYNTDRFMEYAQKYLALKINEDAIVEVRDVRLEDEIVEKRYEDKINQLKRAEETRRLIESMGSFPQLNETLLRQLVESMGSSSQVDKIYSQLSERQFPLLDERSRQFMEVMKSSSQVDKIYSQLSERQFPLLDERSRRFMEVMSRISQLDEGSDRSSKQLEKGESDNKGQMGDTSLIDNPEMGKTNSNDDNFEEKS
jgi:hypothetical protein